ncbi:hypothetical protein AB894_15000, partial [Piscirickettsia salmonis]
CAASRHVTLCDADSRGFIVVAFCSAILHHWMCKIPTEVATLTIIVAGHTDNLRISNARFRSNWDLSAARAVSVALALFRDKGLEQKRFMVVGYADTQALEDNKTAANRSKNRRVEITVVFGKDEEGGEFSIDDEEIGLPDDF